MSEHGFVVEGATCDHCKSTIEAAVGDLDDVSAVDLDLDSKRLMVQGGEPDVIQAAVAAAGYEAVPG